MARSIASPPGVCGARAVLVGAVEVVLLTALTLHSNLLFGRYITAASLPNGAIFMFVATLVANAAVRRFRPHAALGRVELALVFSMLYISAALPQASVAETLVSLAVVPAQFPRGAPYLRAFGGHVPPWLLVRDPDAVRRFYSGFGSAGGAIPWGAWIAPLAGWSLFVGLILVSLACVSRAFVHRWIVEERVMFPLMELPIELLGESRAPLWRDPLTYCGAAIPATMILLGQLHGYYPFIPDWQQILVLPIGKPWSDPPLNALSDFQISIWPLVIGISYMLTSEVAVSIWLFHLLFWAQLLGWSIAGYPPYGRETGFAGFVPLDWIHDMEFGAAIVMSVVLLWPLRRDLGRAMGALVRRKPGDDLAIPPWTVGGFLAANAGLLGWAWAAGESPAVMAGFLLCLYAIVLALSRMVAAGGLYLVDNGFTPQELIYGLAGTERIGAASHFALTGQEALFGRADMSFLYFATNDAKLAHETGAAGRWHGIGMGVSVAAALVSAYVFLLVWGYRYGASSFRAWPLNGLSTSLFDRTSAALSAPTFPDRWTYSGIAAGAAAGLFLVFMNRRFLWWAVSPFGFVVASSWNIANQIWSSVLIGWACAGLIRRYGGLRIYRKLRPFFLGLILGDAVTFCMVVLIESVVGVRMGG